ncbi:MAG: hypothetical protein ACMUHM_09190, partial [Thermoplasmatota archaeon]
CDMSVSDLDDLVFTLLLLDGSTELTARAPVPNGTVWVNITIGSFRNCTELITDDDGMVTINYTMGLFDSFTGEPIRLPRGEERSNVTIEAKFIGKRYYTGSINTRFTTYTVPESSEERSLTDLMRSGMKIYLILIFHLSILVYPMIVVGVAIALCIRKLHGSEKKKRYTLDPEP